MSQVKWRNTDLKAIKVLLKEVGRYRYDMVLERLKLIKQPPLGMKGFYLEADDSGTFLYYTYPSGVTFQFIQVDEFMQIPENGWERIEK